VPNSKQHIRAGAASPTEAGQGMSVTCPFCGLALEVTTAPRRVVLAHVWPLCDAWDRVCYVGGFSQAEREALDALIRGFEPGSEARGGAIEGTPGG
jgi:hypothetical protein